MFHKLCKAVISSPYCPVVFGPWSDALWATCRVPDYHKHQNNLRYKWYETSNSKNWQKQAKPKGKKLFYIIMDRKGKKKSTMSAPFIVHSLVIPNIPRNTKCWPLSYLQPRDGHLWMASTSKFLGRRGDGFALWLGGRQRQGGQGLLCQVSCDGVWWFWLVWLTIMETCLLEWFLYLIDLNKNIPLVNFRLIYMPEKS